MYIVDLQKDGNADTDYPRLPTVGWGPSQDDPIVLRVGGRTEQCQTAVLRRCN